MTYTHGILKTTDWDCIITLRKLMYYTEERN